MILLGIFCVGLANESFETQIFRASSFKSKSKASKAREHLFSFLPSTGWDECNQ